ncbi:hypothetical protein HCA69_02325 [Listeria grandensis]|uniref:Uncharacterized protein n=1 Tax=Listeria grandensis TaxID=1494963 RepID=A0A7X1CNR5_9LIST|nr:hypothetical protein [Listeria grandensis]MBC1935186.1 hypothetical protein [Listeria grandensis]
MSIPVGQKYMKPEGGPGKLANYQGTKADSTAAGDEIRPGAAVQVVEEVSSPLKDGGSFYGVAIAQNFTTTFRADKNGNYSKYDAVPVLREGTIWVEVDEDVKASEKAVANTDTANFLPSTTSKTTKTEVIGMFKTTAHAGNLAQLEINLP